MRPTRDTAAGRAYLDLQNKARKEKRPTDELLVLYALEGFLARLAASAHTDELILKGGVLLAAFLVRRPTRDVDLQAQALPNGTDTVLDLVRSIAASAPADGVEDGLERSRSGLSSLRGTTPGGFTPGPREGLQEACHGPMSPQVLATDSRLPAKLHPDRAGSAVPRSGARKVLPSLTCRHTYIPPSPERCTETRSST